MCSAGVLLWYEYQTDKDVICQAGHRLRPSSLAVFIVQVLIASNGHPCYSQYLTLYVLYKRNFWTVSSVPLDVRNTFALCWYGMCIVSSTSNGHPGSSRSKVGSALDFRPPGRAIVPVSGVWFITKFASLTLIRAKPGLKQQSAIKRAPVYSPSLTCVMLLKCLLNPAIFFYTSIESWRIICPFKDWAKMPNFDFFVKSYVFSPYFIVYVWRING